MTELALNLDLGWDVDPFDPTLAPLDLTVRPVDESDLPEHLLDLRTASLTAEAADTHGFLAGDDQHLNVATTEAIGHQAAPTQVTYPLEVVGPDEMRAPIRAWFDDAGRLVRFVVSNRWRERLLGRDLGAEITEVLRQPRSAAAAVTAPAVAVPLPTRLTQEWLDQMYQESAQDWAAATEPPQEPDRAALGRSRNRLVTVELATDGMARSVTIDSTWLSRCLVSDLCEAVVEAHQAASDALAALPRTASESLSASMTARTDALFAVLTGRTAA